MTASPAGTVDIHAHIVPTPLIDLVRDGGVGGVSVLDTPDGVCLTADNARLGPIRPPMLDCGSRIAWMDQRGIDTQWVSPWLDLFTWRRFDPEDGRRWAAAVNTALASATQGSGGRLRPVPFVDLSAGGAVAGSDAVAAVGRDDAPAVVVNSQAPEVGSLAEESVDPLWSALAAAGIPVVLHPPVNGPSCAMTPTVLQNVSGRLIDTSVAVLDLMIGGVFERYPELAVVVVHGGGYLPYQAHRLDGLVRAGLLPKTRMTASPLQAIQRLYFDTVALDEISIELLIRRVGAEHVLLGSDAPFPIGDPDPVGTIGMATLVDEQRQLVLGGNARKLEALRAD